MTRQEHSQELRKCLCMELKLTRKKNPQEEEVKILFAVHLFIKIKSR